MYPCLNAFFLQGGNLSLYEDIFARKGMKASLYEGIFARRGIYVCTKAISQGGGMHFW